MNQVKVLNDTYSSVSEAWRELSPEGLPEITVRWRLSQGWPTYQAFKTPPIEPELRRLHKAERD
jgi:hypothetical protein